MERIIIGCAVIVAGILAIKTREEMAEQIEKTNNSGWGFHKYGDKEKKRNAQAGIVFGVFFIILGCSILLTS